MRIAQFSDSFLPIVDGVGRVAAQYAACLGERGHESYAVCPIGAFPYLGGLPFEIIEFAGVPVPGSPQYMAGMPILDAHYHARLATRTFDLLHAHTPGPAGLEAVRLAAKRGLPLIGTFHSKYYDDFYRVTKSEALSSLGARLVADFYSRCTEVWTVSAAAAETLREYGYTGETVVVPNGTDCVPVTEEERVRARVRFGLGGEPVLLYVGQIDWKKNLRRVVEACAMVRRPFRLVFAGKGQDSDAVRRLAGELGLGDRLLLTGHLSDDGLLRGLYAEAALFVFPSVYDTAGLVVREAAVQGTPSVVTAGSAPAEVVRHGENGLVSEDSTEGLAAAIDEALADPAVLRRMGEAARAGIPVPWNKVMETVEARYARLL